MKYLIFLLFFLGCGPHYKNQAEVVVTYDGVVEAHHLPDFDSEEKFRNELSDDKGPDFIIFSSPYCGACIDLKNILNNLGWRDKVIVLNFHEKWVNFIAQTIGINAVPAMIIDKDRGKTISEVYVGSGEIGKVLYEHLEKKK
jgi:thiol-disulfide isomerase/thioredoxin